MRDIDSTNQLITSSSRGTRLAAWLVILLSVSFLVVRNAGRGGSDEDSLARTVRMKLFAQEAIAVKSLPPAIARSINDDMPRLIRLIDQQAQTPEDKLRVAIIAGYLETGNGLHRLDTLSSANNSSPPAGDIDAIRTIYTQGADSLQPVDRDRLIQHYGYFANVALASGSPNNTTANQALIAEARRTLLLLVLMVPGFLALFATSIALLVAGFIYRRKGTIRPHYTPAPSLDTSYLEAFALYLAIFIAIGLAARGMGLVSLSWNWVAWLIMPAAMLWTKRRSTTPTDWRTAVGWYSGRGVLREATAGIAGYLAGIPFIMVAAVVSLILIRITGATPRGPIIQYLNGNILALYAIACVFAPVLEETMFRGVLFHYLRARWSWPASAALVALVFAIIHPQGLAAVPVLGAIAMVLAALREWRGSIIASMAAHAFNNFIAITIAVLFLR